MKNDYDTDLDVMFCWGYGFINDPVCSMESDGKKEPERRAEKEEPEKRAGKKNREKELGKKHREK